jgi:mannose-6-phosphate isomerase-like protein (cupin superfamily)|tara:strand:+ start:5963 stop:6319 length:357 start_codon:yes stop_codon:yes gene_type:complete
VKKNKYRLNLNDISESQINHGNGIKKVFINNENTKTSLTQFAWSRFKPGESCERHSHPTMDEYFFVYKGSGTYVIDEEQLQIQEGDFIRIPANTPHSLFVSNTDVSLELIYLGIDISR